MTYKRKRLKKSKKKKLNGKFIRMNMIELKI